MTQLPTVQGISNLLREAGFLESQSSPSGDPRLATRTEGYAAGKWYTDGVVAVKHQIAAPSRTSGVVTQVRIHEKLDAYAKALEAAGYKVVRDQVGFGEGLIVSAPTEAQA